MKPAPPMLVLLVGVPAELALLHERALGLLPVAPDMVTSSRLVAGLEGVVALSWLSDVHDLQQALDVLAVLNDMVVDLSASYRKRMKRDKVEEKTAFHQLSLIP